MAVEDAAPTAIAQAAESVRSSRPDCVTELEAAVETNRVTQDRIDAKTSFPRDGS